MATPIAAWVTAGFFRQIAPGYQSPYTILVHLHDDAACSLAASLTVTSGSLRRRRRSSGRRSRILSLMYREGLEKPNRARYRFNVMNERAEGFRRKAFQYERAASIATDPEACRAYLDLTRQLRTRAEQAEAFERRVSSPGNLVAGTGLRRGGKTERRDITA
jgi:hypothetical protein